MYDTVFISITLVISPIITFKNWAGRLPLGEIRISHRFVFQHAFLCGGLD